MSASAAAAALIQHDADIAAQVVRFDRTDDENRYRLSRRDEGVAILESALGTWTLALAAAAANVSELQVLTAMAYQLNLGTLPVCRGIAARLVADEVVT